MPPQRRKWSPSAGIFCALALCSILIAGLWPFGHPRNDVTWLANQNGVRLGKRATILSSRPLPDGNVGLCTLEMWLRPRVSRGSGTLLAFYGPSGTVGLSLHQSLTDLRLDRVLGRGRTAKIYVDNAFHAERLVFLTVVSQQSGTAAYLDGAPVRQVSGFSSSLHDCTGNFVVGDSPKTNNTWEGDLSGLAIYRHAFTPEQAMLNYWSWRNTGQPADNVSGKPVALYLFDENGGKRIRDHGFSGVRLSIPERYMIAQPTVLESPWRAFEPTWDYVQDIGINIGGFVPFGFTLSAFLLSNGQVRRVGALSVLFGFFVSLTIEALQAYLPTRDSDLTDVVTNTFGTWLGVMLHRAWISQGLALDPISKATR